MWNVNCKYLFSAVLGMGFKCSFGIIIRFTSRYAFPPQSNNELLNVLKQATNRQSKYRFTTPLLVFVAARPKTETLQKNRDKIFVPILHC